MSKSIHYMQLKHRSSQAKELLLERGVSCNVVAYARDKIDAFVSYTLHGSNIVHTSGVVPTTAWET